MLSNKIILAPRAFAGATVRVPGFIAQAVKVDGRIGIVLSQGASIIDRAEKLMELEVIECVLR
jgi:hypothetical protein